MSGERGPNRFDDFTRALAAGASRREALKVLAASAGTVLLGWLGTGRAAAGDEEAQACRVNGQPCTRRRQCCTRNCVDGTCRCRDVDLPCRSSAQCCSTICEKGACRCREFKQNCTSDAECCQDNPKILGGRARPAGATNFFRITCQQGTCTCIFPFSDPCTSTAQCCFGTCESNVCVCRNTGEVCTSNEQCCGQPCSGGFCGGCRGDGEVCKLTSQCCGSLACLSGTCQSPP